MRTSYEKCWRRVAVNRNKARDFENAYIPRTQNFVKRSYSRMNKNIAYLVLKEIKVFAA